jgi:hypothetical protein
MASGATDPTWRREEGSAATYRCMPDAARGFPQGSGPQVRAVRGGRLPSSCWLHRQTAELRPASPKTCRVLCNLAYRLETGNQWNIKTNDPLIIGLSAWIANVGNHLSKNKLSHQNSSFFGIVRDNPAADFPGLNGTYYDQPQILGPSEC